MFIVWTGTIMGSAFEQPITDKPRRGLQLCSSLQRAFCASFRRSDPSVKKLENRHKSIGVTDATWGLADRESKTHPYCPDIASHQPALHVKS